MVRTLRVLLALPLTACSPASFDDFVGNTGIDAGDAALEDASAIRDARVEGLDARVVDASVAHDSSVVDASHAQMDADTPPACFAAGASLISYFPFDGSPDDVRAGAPVVTVDAQFGAGRVGSALVAGEVSATQSRLDQPSALTIATWLRLDAYPQELNAPFVWKGGDVGDDFSTNFWLVVAGSAFHEENATYLVGKGAQGHLGLALTDGTSEQFLLTETPLPLLSWVHVVATFDGTNARLFLDGSLVQERPQQVVPKLTSTPLRFASALGGTVAALPGALDEAAFLSRALTPDEVASLHQRNGSFCRP